MPLRLLELTIPAQEAGRLPALLEKQPALGVWQFRSANGGVMVRILLDAEHVEALSDILIDSFGSRDDFRMILLAVEATLPRIRIRPSQSGASNLDSQGCTPLTNSGHILGSPWGCAVSFATRSSRGRS